MLFKEKEPINVLFCRWSNIINILSPHQSFRDEKRKQEKKRRKKEIYQNVRYKSKLRLVTTVFDVASNGNGIPSIHASPVGERKERTTSQHPFQRIRRYEECRFANFNGATVSWLDLPHWIISISIVTGVETPL